ncbi:serine/threonine protein phosphatase [Azospirillum sp. RWY-5-1]|uniref:Serine/threonine protein phosphatase n=1 Tax=Azospirillum oleiclasticum TaxID=2735135 RepID=A0ABX2TI94_9PROT|nr:serine/threonine protein phosphatase [Azospirillum oleiclasticum]NYZ22898.1 serine/threonine protein phosphatase [Azospirillum oleiclasticum]
MVFGFARWQKAEPAAAAVPRGVRVYAVGDVHGRLDLLDQLLDRIEADARTAGDRARYLVFLGDYVDRGPQSRGVIERLIAGPPPGFGAIHLKGNHEASFLGFLEDVRVGPGWFRYGGLATLASYGVTPPPEDAPVERLLQVQGDLREAVPPHHQRFLERLKPSVTIGDYVFVHAGVRPGVPLPRQKETDLLWIREEFLKSNVDHGKVVVHGHTISIEPELRGNRIGIDTGAYATHRLTCVVLEDTDRRFLTTA